jgi:hypothetical protein
MVDDKYQFQDPFYNYVDPDLSSGLISLRPNCAWSLTGDDYSTLKWQDDPALKPTEEEVLAEVLRLRAQAPWNALRRVRNALLKDCDWVVIKAMSRNEPVPQVWVDYMQALRDITETDVQPRLDGRILKNVEWPQKPEGY